MKLEFFFCRRIRPLYSSLCHIFLTGLRVLVARLYSGRIALPGTGGCTISWSREHRAKIVDKPAVHHCGTDYEADRAYGALDPEGHLWWFTQRLRSAGK